jgi:hypothetical protein
MDTEVQYAISFSWAKGIHPIEIHKRVPLLKKFQDKPGTGDGNHLFIQAWGLF